MTTFSRKVLVVAAHPDDEVLGCGATIANHSEQGDQVSVLIMAEGATSRLSKRERSVVMTELTELN
ncbi:MAG: PIG-L deacetylase family protein, partial [Aeromonas sobria]